MALARSYVDQLVNDAHLPGAPVTLGERAYVVKRVVSLSSPRGFCPVPTLQAEGKCVSNVQLVLVEGRPGVTIDTAAIVRGFDIDLCGVGFPMTADSVAVHRLRYTLLPGLHDKLTCLQLNGAASASEATVLPSLRITSFGRVAGHATVHTQVRRIHKYLVRALQTGRSPCHTVAMLN